MAKNNLMCFSDCETTHGFWVQFTERRHKNKDNKLYPGLKNLFSTMPDLQKWLNLYWQNKEKLWVTRYLTTRNHYSPSGHSYSGQHSPSGIPLLTHSGLGGRPHWNSGHMTVPPSHLHVTHLPLTSKVSPCLYSTPSDIQVPNTKDAEEEKNKHSSENKCDSTWKGGHSSYYQLSTH